jgi:hypothetical protein
MKSALFDRLIEGEYYRGMTQKYDPEYSNHNGLFLAPASGIRTPYGASVFQGLESMESSPEGYLYQYNIPDDKIYDLETDPLNLGTKKFA